MEKNTPHCSLAVVKTLIDAGAIRTTRTAREGAVVLGFDLDGLTGVVLALTRADFYKSMTTHDDHRVWQDVYRPHTPAGQGVPQAHRD